MRIVHILTRLSRAGTEENTLITAAGQIEHGHEVIIIHGRDALVDFAHELAPRAELIEVPELVRELKPYQDIAATVQIRKILTQIRPDVVHTHQSKAGIVGRVAAALAGVPLVIHGVHILPFLGVGRSRKYFYLWIERAVGSLSDGFIHVSEGMRTAAIENKIGLNKRHYVVPSGFDLNHFRDALPAQDLQLLKDVKHGDKPPIMIAMLAALEPRKRHLEFLQHGAGFLKAHPHVHLLFAGEGPLRAEIEKLISDLNLESQVSLLGYRSDPASVLAAADIGVLCAEREGLPRCILQSLVSALPVVLFNLPGIEEVVRDGSNGHIVPQDDWTAYFSTLADLVMDHQRREKMAKDASCTDLERWEAGFMADHALEIYDELAGPNQQAGELQ